MMQVQMLSQENKKLVEEMNHIKSHLSQNDLDSLMQYSSRKNSGKNSPLRQSSGEMFAYATNRFDMTSSR